MNLQDIQATDAANVAPSVGAVSVAAEGLAGIAAYAERAPVAIAVTTEGSWVLQYINPAFRQLTRTEGTLILGRPLTEVFPELNRPRVRAALCRAEQGSRTSREIAVTVASPEDPATHFRLSAWPLSVGNSPTQRNQRDRASSGIVLQLRDATEEQRAKEQYAREIHQRHVASEMELREVNKRLVVAALREEELGEDARMANEAKSIFLASMSHELRTPLNAIIGYTSLIDEELYGPVQKEQHRYLGRIKISARHLLSLIDEVLTFSRLDAGQERIYWEQIDSDALLDKTIVLTTPLADMKQLALVTCPVIPPLIITSDFGKTLQILVNLITNAIKFTDHGEVRLSVYSDSNQAYFTVRDTGIGIPAVHLDRIFDSFWQVDQASTRRIGGTGLGLSVSRKLARLLGGDLTVQSTLGQGSTFTLSLPLVPDATELS